MDKPSVSVIIPAFNAERYLDEAISSVLRQGYEPLELIVVDDGSTDATTAVVRSYERVGYERQEHRGIGAARNRGVELTTGDLLAFLDADDVWVPGKLALQVEALCCMPEIDMVFGYAQNFRDGGAIRPEPPRPAYVAGAMLIRRHAFARTGLFTTELRLGEFIDWYLRATEAGLKSHVLPEVVLRRRIHDNNTGIRERDRRRDYVRLLKASLDRRRG